MDVQFNEDNFGGRGVQTGMPGTGDENVSKMASWLVNAGLAKDAASANTILTVCALLFLAMSVYFFVFGFSKPAVMGPDRPADTGFPPRLEN